MSERADFLRGACDTDPGLRARLQQVVQVLAEAEPVEKQVPENQSDSDLLDALDLALQSEDTPSSVIGPYKLLQQVGEGGFGVVWLAEQQTPVRRRVALKILKGGMDTKEVIARFEAERQALALMDHPNIARVFDAGETADGRPYFVMELVRGVPITQHCDQHKVPAAERLRLFIAICHAVLHAHQKGVIHRDLKPSNILVTMHDGVPVPKIIDFGIAKAIATPLTEKTLFTQLHSFLGTPAYTSPEQMEMSGLDVDTRSDIYSLGVLLYELLTGHPPFDPDTLMKSGLEAMRHTIREVDPLRPSQRLGTFSQELRGSVARERGTEAAKLALLLRGDLDWIVMHCLEKDRTRRYETANALAADVQRYLDSEPIVARPPSTTYRMGKFVRRHKTVVAASSAVLLTLVAGVIVSSVLYVRERSARERAVAAQRTTNLARTQAEELVAQMTHDLQPDFEKRGELKVQREAAAAALRYYQGLPDELRGVKTQLAHATAIENMVWIRGDAGESEGLEQAWRAAGELRRKVAVQWPDDPEAAADLLRNENLARAWFGGDKGTAEVNLRHEMIERWRQLRVDTYGLHQRTQTGLWL